MINEENVNKVGYGSWWLSQRYVDYRDSMSYNEYHKYKLGICNQRLLSFNLQKGDLIKIEYIGGHKVRRYTGEFNQFAGSLIIINQKKRMMKLELYLIDDVEVLERVNKKVIAKVYNFKDYLH